MIDKSPLISWFFYYFFNPDRRITKQSNKISWNYLITQIFVRFFKYFNPIMQCGRWNSWFLLHFSWMVTHFGYCMLSLGEPMLSGAPIFYWITYHTNARKISSYVSACTKPNHPPRSHMCVLSSFCSVTIWNKVTFLTYDLSCFDLYLLFRYFENTRHKYPDGKWT